MTVNISALIAAPDGGTMPKNRLSLFDWIHERHENTLRIADGKIGSDKDGWLEDAAYFEEAANLQTELSQLRSELSTLRGAAEEMESALKVLEPHCPCFQLNITKHIAGCIVESALARYQEVKK